MATADEKGFQIRMQVMGDAFLKDLYLAYASVRNRMGELMRRSGREIVMEIRRKLLGGWRGAGGLRSVTGRLQKSFYHEVQQKSRDVILAIKSDSPYLKTHMTGMTIRAHGGYLAIPLCSGPGKQRPWDNVTLSGNRVVRIKGKFFLANKGEKGNLTHVLKKVVRMPKRLSEASFEKLARDHLKNVLRPRIEEAVVKLIDKKAKRRRR